MNVVRRLEPHIEDVFRSNPRDDEGYKEDEQYCKGWAE